MAPDEMRTGTRNVCRKACCDCSCHRKKGFAKDECSIVVAMDGTAIEVWEVKREEHDEPWWRGYWNVGDETHFIPWVGTVATRWRRAPTDAEVLAEYEKYKAAK